MLSSYAPIVLFTYKRLDTLKLTIESLKKNKYAEQSELFIFVDGPKSLEDQEKVHAVRTYIETIEGFKEVNIVVSEKNKGLAASIIEGVTSIINTYGKVIVLEDDLITSSNFLLYMNKALDFYESDQNVFSVSGFTTPIRKIKSDEVYFTKRASSWGWATWKNRWADVDWTVNDYHQFLKNKKIQRDFNRMGSDMSGMLKKQMEGKINSWAIRWCYHQFKNDLYTVFPAVSKVINVGFGKEATHTKFNVGRFKTILDTSNNTLFNFSENVKLSKKIIRQFVRPYSMRIRLKYKLLNLFLNLN